MTYLFSYLFYYYSISRCIIRYVLHVQSSTPRKADIISGAYTSRVICEAPHRARGQVTLEEITNSILNFLIRSTHVIHFKAMFRLDTCWQEFRRDPLLTQCEFEPGIEYTCPRAKTLFCSTQHALRLILYLDVQQGLTLGGGTWDVDAASAYHCLSLIKRTGDIF